MNKVVVMILVVFFLYGCDVVDEASTLKENFDEEQVWIFGQFNVPENADGVESYFYYGLISKPLYEEISRNKLQSGFILLQNVKYWGEDNLIYDFRDEEDEGSILFRIEDIRKLTLVRKEPATGIGMEQFEEPIPEPAEVDSAASTTSEANKALNSNTGRARAQ